MACDLSKVGERERLKTRREPYWHRLRAGCFIGFRPSKRGGAGTWIARIYDEDTSKYQIKSLGDFGVLAGNARFAAAKKEAETLAELVEAGGEIRLKVETVADACRSYAETRPEAEQRFKRYVYGDVLGKVKLAKLRKRHVADWRKRLEETPSLVSRSNEGDKRVRIRAPSTVNRDMAVLRAALATVLPAGAPNSEAAWQEGLKSIPNSNGRRTLYLDRPQRRLLLEKISVEAQPFVQALCLLPLRPGAMAALTAGDFDKRTSELSIGKDKTGKLRRIQLPSEASKLLTSQAADKLPNAPLFMRANGKPWDKETWKLPIAAAVKTTNLPPGATAYTLRHSTITDLVSAGLPLLTIAQISGTSAEMIERHYGHLASSAAVKALETLAL
ncbi:tyrosine-type recombinase/integrase [Pontixanthobacter gangjinensis]|uniref:Tyrosine-type recombinase/integrase n=1 Tax=Pontixanthobacter gangjinensis TaxID=1028742 RepID=A0A6I4SJF0_9SPHN|nr:tyrosine-type recombinase/integrase [Pontixanthobacter gangjinensis]MXO55793.1 tyrosine-type recombinase/integrase [Pontixanthobacter gangjinensis]